MVQLSAVLPDELVVRRAQHHRRLGADRHDRLGAGRDRCRDAPGHPRDAQRAAPHGQAERGDRARGRGAQDPREAARRGAVEDRRLAEARSCCASSSRRSARSSARRTARSTQVAELRGKIERGGLPEEALQGGDARARSAARHAARLARVLDGAQLPRVDGRAAVEQDDRDADRSRPRAKQILDEDHFDLDKVKERILEFLAVQRLKQHAARPADLLRRSARRRQDVDRPVDRARDGPRVRAHLARRHATTRPRSAATAARTSARCPARSSAACAAPAAAIRCSCSTRSTSSARDFRGDPAAALLEVLDPEQNNAFRDHYLDVPFDLSRVMFIATANVLDTIPAAAARPHGDHRAARLHRRGQARRSPKRYLVPKQVEDNGLVLGADIAFTDDALLEMIRGYTHEAGVRKLEQLIASVCRKRARQLADGRDRHADRRSRRRRRACSGPPKYRIESQVAGAHEAARASRSRSRGPPSGGEVLFVESTACSATATATSR